MAETYRSVIARPRARLVLIALVAAWTSFGMVGLSVLLVSRDAAGSFGVAGACVAVFALASGVLAPLRGQLVDRLGPGRVLPVATAGYALGLLALAAFGASDAPGAALFAAAAFAGASAPPLVATVRTMWPGVVPPDEVRRGYALTSMIGDAGFVVGPVLAGAIATAASSGVAAITAAAAAIIATALVLAAGAPRTSGSMASARERMSPLRSDGMRTLIASGVGVGGVLGALTVAVPAFADSAGRSDAAGGILLAAFGAGSMVGGFWFGKRTWANRAATRYLVALTVLTLGTLPLAAATNVVVLGVFLVIAGAAFGPATVSLFEVLDEAAPPGTETEALTWITTAEGAGLAGAAAVAGSLVSHDEIALAFLLGATASGVATGIAAARRTSLSAPWR